MKVMMEQARKDLDAEDAKKGSSTEETAVVAEEDDMDAAALEVGGDAAP